ncbi:MAG: TIR domain-containing protein [Gammaproteobacteria bacterium]|nr:TIR domain-containing protein [Gammaproteobacteria bacterium]
MARVFISHSSRDKEPAERIMAWLGEQGFETPFLDFDKHGGIPPGADWEKTLYREIERAEAIVIIQTPDWLDSKWCFAEFTQARALGKAIFPIIETPTGDTLISPDIQALDLIKDREGGLEQLCSQLTRIALDAQGGFDWDTSRPPYPGLLAFQEEDAALYFGRDDDIRRLIERLDARRAQGGSKLIALLGASGSGKSSLLRAGVIPRLKRAGNNWIVLPTMRPQVRPVDELARSLAVACAGDAGWRELREELNGDNLASSLSDIANDLRMQASANEAQILLPIDQGEELFGAANPDQAKRFCEIIDVALSSDLPFIAVIALRSDYLGSLQSAEHLSARFEEFSLGPMPLGRIAQIIEGPARVAGLDIDEAFVHQAVQDAKTEDALPLLAFALRELYDHAADGKHLSLAEYDALGDAKEELTPLENAVRKAADNVVTVAQPDEKELTALREAFVPAMVRVNEQGEYVRRPARWDDLPSKAHSLLERLAKARLLIISQDSDDRMVEVAHEALLRKWPRLRSWLDDAREFLAGKQQLERDLHDWEHAAEEDRSAALLTGLKLNRARAWLIERPHQLTDEERSLVQASIKHADAAERHKVRTGRIITVVSIVALVVLTVIAGFALIAKNDANRNLVSASLALAQSAAKEENWNENLIYLLRAYTVAPDNFFGFFGDPRRESALRLIGGHARRVGTALHHERPVTSAVFNPSGTSVFTIDRANIARIWNPDKGTQLAVKVAEGVISSVAFSPDGQRIFLTVDNSTIRAYTWDLQRGSHITPTVIEDGVRSVAFSPDGRRILTVDYDGNLKVSNLDSGTEVPLMKVPDGGVKFAAFSPDNGRVLIVGNSNAAQIWDVERSQKISITRDSLGNVVSAAFGPDGARILVVENSNTVRIWDLDGGNESLAIEVPNINSAALSANGKRVLTIDNSNRVRVWNVATGEPRADFKISFGGTAVFSPDGERILTAGDKSLAIGEDAARIWDVDTGKQIAIMKVPGYHFTSAEFSPDGMRVLATSLPEAWHRTAGTLGSTVRIWDFHGSIPESFKDFEEAVDSPKFRSNGKRPMISRNFDLRPSKPLPDKLQSFYFYAESPDGRTVLVADQEKDWAAQLWDLKSETLLASLDVKETVGSAAFSPDGTRIVTAGGSNTPRLWDWDAKTRRVKLRKDLAGRGRLGHEMVTITAAYSADGMRVVTSSEDGTARVWNAQNGRLVAILEGGEGSWVRAAAFSPDGARVITANYVGVAQIWDTETGQEIAVAGGNAGLNVAFSSDGVQVAAGNSPAWIRRLDAEACAELEWLRLSVELRSGLAWDDLTDRPYRLSFKELEKRRQELSDKHDGKFCDARDR